MAPMHKGAGATVLARLHLPREQWQGSPRIIRQGSREALRRPKRDRSRCATACQTIDSAIADSGADSAGDELESFETHVGMVEPVDESDAEVSMKRMMYNEYFP